MKIDTSVIPDNSLNDSFEGLIVEIVPEYEDPFIDELRMLKEQIEEKEHQIEQLQQQIQCIKTNNYHLEAEISGIKQSLTWKIQNKFHSIFIEKLFPANSFQRKYYNSGLNCIRLIANNGLRGLAGKFLDYWITCCDNVETCKVIQNSISHPQRKLIFNNAKISILIVTYNSEKIIENALNSIIEQNYPLSKIEIIVIDNNSSDGTIQTVEKFIDRATEKVTIKLVDNKKNYGFGKANNIGERYSSAESQFLLLLNPDCKLYEDTISNLVEAASNSHENGYRVWEGHQLPYEHPKHYNPVTLETSWTSGACCLIDREVFKNIGGFDENIFLYLEDVDISWRIRLMGFKLMYVPRAYILHESYDEPFQIKTAMYYNSVLYGFYLRHKFGKFKDVIRYYLKFSLLVINPPCDLKRERVNLIKQFRRHFSLIPKAKYFRRKYRTQTKNFEPLFINFDFEIHRPGAFEKSSLAYRKMEELPMVSIVVRTMGKKGFIREALISIRNQTYPNIEVVVIEDGPESIREMLKSEFSDLNLKYFALGKNQGRCFAGNYGLGKSSGKYLRFLDEDDLLYANSVETAVCIMLENKNKAKLVYDLAFEIPTEVVSEEPFVYCEGSYRVAINEGFSREKLFRHNLLPIQCALFDRELFEKYGGFDENLEVLEDWDLWIHYSMYTDFIKISKVTSLYRVPADKAIQTERQRKFDSYYNIVREKHGLDTLIKLY